jgi:hypothetical protein
MVWDRTYDDSDDGLLYSICAAPDGGYVAAGSAAKDNDYSDYRIVKIDAGGNRLWQRSFGSPGDDTAFSVIPGYGNSFIVTGYITDYAIKSKDFWIINIDRNGEIPPD